MFQTPVQPKPRLIWRGLFCLLMGGLTWWLALKLIEPKPLWTIFPKASEARLDITDVDDVQGLALLTGFGITTDKSTAHVVSLKTGEVLHTLEDIYPLDVRSVEDPRWMNQYIWRMTRTDDELQLRVWNPLGGEPERIHHQWKGHPEVDRTVTWPHNSSTFMINSEYSLKQAFSVFTDMHFPGSCIGLMMMETLPFSIKIHELWELANDRKNTVSRIRRWLTCCDDASIECSADGKKLVSLRSMPFNVYDMKRRLSQNRKSSEETYTGSELQHAFRGDLHSLELIDASTGKLLFRYQLEDNIYVDYHYVVGNFVLLKYFWLDPTKKYHVDFGQQTADYFLKKAVESRIILLQIRDDRLIPIGFPDGLDIREAVNTLPPDGLLLTAKSREVSASNQSLLAHVELDGKQFQIRTLQNIGENDYIQLLIQSQGYLHHVRRPSPLPEALLRYINKHESLKSFFKGWAEHSIAIVWRDSSFQERWRWPDTTNLLKTTSHGLQYLFLTPYVYLDGGRTETAMMCYQVPMIVWSYWWARGAGLGTVILAWLLCRWRFQRLHRAGSAIS